MSWSVSVTGVDQEEVHDAIDEALDAQLAAATFDSWDDSVQAQQDFAKDIAQQIADSEVAGDGPFNISCHGHRSTSEGPSNHSFGVSVTEVNV